jgi:hypothetical protein
VLKQEDSKRRREEYECRLEAKEQLAAEQDVFKETTKRKYECLWRGKRRERATES